MAKKQWAVVVVNNPVVYGSPLPTSVVGHAGRTVIATLPCPEDDAKDIYVEGSVAYWTSKMGSIVILEETGEDFKGSPLFREVKDETETNNPQPHPTNR